MRRLLTISATAVLAGLALVACGGGSAAPPVTARALAGKVGCTQVTVNPPPVTALADVTCYQAGPPAGLYVEIVTFTASANEQRWFATYDNFNNRAAYPGSGSWIEGHLRAAFILNCVNSCAGGLPGRVLHIIGGRFVADSLGG